MSRWVEEVAIRGGAILAGMLTAMDPMVGQRARDEATKHRIRHTIYALGGSVEQGEAAVAKADAKVRASVESPAFYSLDDAASEVLQPWLTGERQP